MLPFLLSLLSLAIQGLPCLTDPNPNPMKEVPPLSPPPLFSKGVQSRDPPHLNRWHVIGPMRVRA